jgi:hypothetical protein
MLVVAAGFLTSGPAFATDDPEPRPSIEALLRKVEQRVSAKHMMTPEGDSAFDAWQQVLVVVPTTDTARITSAMRNFAVHLRRRATEEQRDGNIAMSAGFSIFASQAEAMIPAKPDPSLAAASGAGDLAPGPSPSSPPPAAPIAAEQTVPPNPELPTEALAGPPQPQPAPASTAVTPAEPARVHHVSEMRPHSAGPSRQPIDVLDAAPPRVDAHGVIQGLLY